MPQETNLSVSPYFDDFSIDKDYYKVLFKPGYPVQARELTTLQSILQNQIEQFGKHIFKDGSVVIPGQLLYNNPVDTIEVEPTFNGSPISLYFKELIGLKIKGSQSGVTAQVLYLLDNIDSEKNNYTLYVKYIQSGGSDFSNKKFSDGETILIDEDNGLSYGLNNFSIQQGQGIFNTLSSNSNSLGSLVRIFPGIYFIRGYFVRVGDQILILDQYGTSPTYKVGFDIDEEIINSEQDESLFDNALGFNNYAAPGSDRFKISLNLNKKQLDEYSNNFIEIFRVIDGIPSYSISENPQYNIIRDEIAKRTYDESGDYIVNPFNIKARDCLNDGYRVNGVFNQNSLTSNGSNPSEDLMIYQVEPGKAYVKGYDVEFISSRYLEVEKPRETDYVENLSLNFNAGTLFVVNNSIGVPPIGIGRTEIVELRNSRIGENSFIGYGITIGNAKVYDYVPESSYENNTSRMFLRLFDIDTYTEINLNSNVTLSTPCHIKGSSSSASGYLKYSAVSTNTLTLYSVSGQFLDNEKIIINGIESNKLITSISDYSIQDIKSVFSSVGINTFSADLCLTRKNLLLSPGTSFDITENSSGICTVSSGLQNNFINSVKPGDIISYIFPNTAKDPIYNKVVSVSAGGTNFTVSGITTVAGICDGGISTAKISVNNIVKITSEIFDGSSGLITRLPNSNISQVRLENSIILQRRTFESVSFTDNTLSISLTESDILFSSFDEDRYIISYYDGKIETIRSDKFLLSLDAKTVTFSDLSVSFGVAKVVTTVQNIKPNSKNKKLNKVNTLTISKSSDNRSGIGSTTLDDGLVYSQIYGLRVQDDEISLNVPDVLRVLAIYESSGIADPQIPKIKLISFTGPTNTNLDYNTGEIIRGKSSNAVGIVVNKVNSDEIEFVYLNTSQFLEGEVITGEDTNTKSIVNFKYLSDKNITNNYLFESGQNLEFYDYSRIIRKKSITSPSKKIKVIFQNYYIDSDDLGEYFTVNSYSSQNYTFDIPYLNQIKDYCSNIIDIRPRVLPYDESINLSPFEGSGRVLSFSTKHANYNIISDDNLIISYDYYLPRIDKIILNKDGTLEVVKGISNKNPTSPPNKTNSITLATIFSDSYVKNVTKETVVSPNILKRYRMSDISLLEDRIERLETYTSLSLSEIKTESLIIKDAETGLNKFKCGFFVEKFENDSLSAVNNKNYKCLLYNNSCYPIPTIKDLDLQLGSESISGFSTTYNPTVDQSFITDLGSPGIKKTGELITLNYVEKLYANQNLSSKTEEPGGFSYWKGNLLLSPSSDNWYDSLSVETNSFEEKTVITDVEDKVITIEKNEVVSLPFYVHVPKPVPTPQPNTTPTSGRTSTRPSSTYTQKTLTLRAIGPATGAYAQSTPWGPANGTNPSAQRSSLYGVLHQTVPASSGYGNPFVHNGIVYKYSSY